MSRDIEFPIRFNRVPPRADFVHEVDSIVKQLPMLTRMGAGERAVLTIAAKTAQFLEGVLSGSVVVDDEGCLCLADDQCPGDVVPLGAHGRVLVNTGLAACESALQLLRQRMAADLAVVHGEPLSVDDDLGHNNSPSIGAVQTLHGQDVPRPTVGDTTDASAGTFTASRVGGLQDGAAVPPIAAASVRGGDAVSSPKRAASPPHII